MPESNVRVIVKCNGIQMKCHEAFAKQSRNTNMVPPKLNNIL